MAKISIKAGTTSKLLDVFIQDSSSTTGAGLGSIAYNTAGLTAYYYREGAASSTSITLATMTLGTWASGGFIVVDGTNMLGCYQIGIPDAAIASGAKSVIVYLKGVTNMAPLVMELELTAVDNQSSTAFITGVNSVAPPTNWNLQSIDSNGRLDVIKIAGTTQTARDIGASVLLSSGTGTGQLDFTSGVVKSNAVQWLGTACSTPTVAGVPNVNTKTWNDLTTVALPLVPTTAGRTLDVSTGGEAGIDWANVGSPTTSLALTGTTIATTQKVDVETIKTNPVVNAGTVTFPTTATLASTTNITAGTVTTATNVTTVNGLAANVITAAATASDFGAEIADAVWDEAIAGHLSAGTTGLALNSAGSAGDPWSTAVPGAYSAGTAGYIVGTNLNATVSSRASQTSVDTVAGYIDTEVGAIKTKTDFLPSATAGAAGGLFIAGSNAATSITTALTANIVGNVTGNLSGSAGSVTGAVGSVTAAVTVGTISADVITSTALASSAVTEIQSGLATSSALSTAQSDITAVKAKTDGLTFTSAGFVDANVQKINDVTITGNGQTGTEFGV